MAFAFNFIIFLIVIMIPVIILSVYLTVLVVRALNKYLKSHGPSSEVRAETEVFSCPEGGTIMGELIYSEEKYREWIQELSEKYRKSQIKAAISEKRRC